MSYPPFGWILIIVENSQEGGRTFSGTTPAPLTTVSNLHEDSGP